MFKYQDFCQFSCGSGRNQDTGLMDINTIWRPRPGLQRERGDPSSGLPIKMKFESQWRQKRLVSQKYQYQGPRTDDARKFARLPGSFCLELQGVDRGDDWGIVCQEEYKFYCHYDKIFSIICGSSHVLHTYFFSLWAAAAAGEADVIIREPKFPVSIPLHPILK